MATQLRPTLSPAMAAVRQLRLGWAEQAEADRAAAARTAAAEATRTPAAPEPVGGRPGGRAVRLPPLPAGPDRCPPTCPYCTRPQAGEGGDGG